VLVTLLPGEGVDARPLLSMFVDAVSQRNGGLLAELESLVRARRETLHHRE
jgi:hypothetical protein